jgi:hypothetical protein
VDGGDYLYALRGKGYTDFWRYSISAGTWTSIASTPAAVGSGGALAWDGDDTIYAFQGSSTTLWRYSISENSWSTDVSTPSAVGVGASLAVKNYHLYALRGGGNTDFWDLYPSTLTVTVSSGTALGVHPFNVQASTAGGGQWSDTVELVVVPAGGAAMTWYVDDDGSDSNTGGSSGSPFQTIGKALQYARSGDTIQMAAGTYNEAITVTVGVTITGNSASDTIVDGGGSGHVISIVDTNNVILQNLTVTGSSSADWMAGVHIGGTSSNITLQNLIVRGNHDGVNVRDSAGNVIVDHVTFANNGAAGIHANSSGSVTVTNSLLYNNLYGLYKSGTGTFTHSYNGFYNNTNGDYGGTGLSPGTGEWNADLKFTNPSGNDYTLQSSSPAIDAATPHTCDSGDNSRADLGYTGGGVASCNHPWYVDDGATSPEIGSSNQPYNTIGEAVSAAISGDTIYVRAGTYNERFGLSSGLTLSGNSASDTIVNGGSSGNVITITNASNVTVQNLTVTGSGSGSWEAGVRVDGTSSNITLQNLVLRNNHDGANVKDSATNVTMDHITFAKNSAAGVNTISTGSITVTNSLLYSNGYGLYQSGSGTFNHSYNGFYDNGSDYANLSPGTGEWNDDLKFTNAAGNDYTLQNDSPAIDAGDPNDSVPSGGGWRCDVGAFEHTGSTVSKTISDGTADYTFGGTRAKLHVDTRGDLSSLQVVVYPDSSPPNGTSSMLQRYYELTPTGSSLTVDLCLAYDDDEVGSLDESQFQLCRWTGSAWDCPARGANSSVTDNLVCADDITQMSTWSISEGQPTAVTLSSFSAWSGETGFLGRLLLVAGLVALAGGVRWAVRQRGESKVLECPRGGQNQQHSC